ncbi:hypothetical protein B0G77_8173 [Paraburkholderia sp. BL10I2N1]|nr:hypothetical protein B0G77_8173 [Paraburkholderia sp. BL10I2N1]
MRGMCNLTSRVYLPCWRAPHTLHIGMRTALSLNSLSMTSSGRSRLSVSKNMTTKVEGPVNDENVLASARRTKRTYVRFSFPRGNDIGIDQGVQVPYGLSRSADGGALS